MGAHRIACQAMQFIGLSRGDRHARMISASGSMRDVPSCVSAPSAKTKLKQTLQPHQLRLIFGGRQFI
jgi:hypothetical protein